MDECALSPIDTIDHEIEDEGSLLETEASEPECWQETTLRLLETWIEERETIIAEIEMRIANEMQAG